MTETVPQETTDVSSSGSISESSEGGEPEDQGDAYKPIPLSQEMMPQFLSMICKTGNGLDFAYIRFVSRNKGLTDITLLGSYKNLRYVDVGENEIQDLRPLSKLPYILSIKADSNLLTEGITKEMPFLQFADFSKNNFSVVQGIYHPELEIIHLKFNQLHNIASIDGSRLGRLHTLELRGNQLESTSGLHLPTLKRLFLAQNAIQRIEGLEVLTQLTFLHLRSNNIKVLDGFSKKNSSLSYVNIRDNNISNFEEIFKLKCLPGLRELIVLENGLIEERENFSMDVVMYLPYLARVNKTVISNRDRREAKQRLKRQLEEAERVRLEEEERLKAEEAARAAEEAEEAEVAERIRLEEEAEEERLRSEAEETERLRLEEEEEEDNRRKIEELEKVGKEKSATAAASKKGGKQRRGGQSAEEFDSILRDQSPTSTVTDHLLRCSSCSIPLTRSRSPSLAMFLVDGPEISPGGLHLPMYNSKDPETVVSKSNTFLKLEDSGPGPVQEVRWVRSLVLPSQTSEILEVGVNSYSSRTTDVTRAKLRKSEKWRKVTDKYSFDSLVQKIVTREKQLLKIQYNRNSPSWDMQIRYRHLWAKY